MLDPDVAGAIGRGTVDALVTYTYEETLAEATRAAGGGAPGVGSQAIIASTRPVYVAMKRAVLADVPGVRVLRDYDVLPVSFVRFTSEQALATVASSPYVQRVSENGHAHTQLAQSLPLIDQPLAAAAGYKGEGTAIAVLDTGVAYKAAGFGDCTSPGVPSTCRVAFAKDFASEDLSLDVAPWHGTNVAGIALGVAPEADILALDVFNWRGTATWSDVTAAINWVVSTQSTYHTRVMNLSMGTEEAYVSECASAALAAPFAAARAVGVLPVVAAGNAATITGAFRSGVAQPACAPGAVRVGAVYDASIGYRAWRWCGDVSVADKVACFSQAGPLLTLLAPGSEITAAGVTMSGTSMAAPHVAGAVAVMTSAAPSASLGEVTTALSTTGPLITDPREAASYRRLDVDSAVYQLTAGYSALDASVVGNGSVVSSPGGINCPTVCTARFATSATVQLGAVASAGWTFNGWTGACTGNANPCAVSMSQARSVTATFVPSNPFPVLTVTRVGSGTVSSTPAGIHCSTVCAAAFAHGSGVTLTATADADCFFQGWSGACSGSSTTCTLTMDGARAVTATFVQRSEYPVSVSLSGSGSVMADSGGLYCPGNCSANYQRSSVVNLTAHGSGSQSFVWGGACSGTTNPCTLTVTGPRSVTVTFFPGNALSVSVVGSGSVVSDPAGISCPGTCSANMSAGSAVGLTANPVVGWEFDGWTGACAGLEPTCTVTMDQARSVTAAFEPIPRYPLDLTTGGIGSIGASPGGVECPGVCSTDYEEDTVVTLTANIPDAWQVTWGGDCAGSGLTCSVTMDRPRAVDATFTPIAMSHMLWVDVTGSGSVVSSPPAIACPGTTCVADLADGSSTELTAEPSIGWLFAGWSGACSGAAPTCTVTMDQSRTVTAVFSQTGGIATTTTGTLSAGYRVRRGITFFHDSTIARYTAALSPLVFGAQMTLELKKWDKVAKAWVPVWTRARVPSAEGKTVVALRGAVYGRGSFAIRARFSGDAGHFASETGWSLLRFTR